MEKKDKIHIALAFDQNFIAPFYVLLTSIFLNNNEKQFVFHAIVEELDEKQRELILFFVQQNKAEILFYSVDAKLIKQFTLSVESPHITSATYYRLFFPELLSKDIDRLIYLDTDIIVIGELDKLYHSSIEDSTIGAVADAKVRSRPDLGIVKEGEYFNAGVLLINLNQWRELKITERTIKFLMTYPDKILLADQDALNNVLLNNWYKLDKKYNITFYDVPNNLKKNQFDRFLNDKVIIHYTTQNKPWLLTCTNRLRYLYNLYLQKSPLAGSAVYADKNLRRRYMHKLFKRRLKELLIDWGISV